MKRLLEDLVTLAIVIILGIILLNITGSTGILDYYRYPSPPDPADAPILKSITVKEGR